MSEEGHPEVDGSLAAWVLDACPAPEADRAADHVALCRTCAVEAGRLRETAALLAVAVRTPPPRALRAVVLAESRRARRPGNPSHDPDGTLTAAYAAQVRAMDRLLTSLTPEEWRTAPPRYASVGHLVDHLAGNDAVFAADLGLAGAPLRAAPGEVWHAQARAVVRGLAANTGLLDRETSLAGASPVRASARTGLVQRAFETWTHADDIRAVVGLPPAPPPGPHLRHVVELGVRFLPRALRAAGRHHPGRAVRLRLTGPGAGEWTVPMAPGEVPGVPDAEVTTSAEAFCRLLANRLDPETFPHHAVGDARLVEDLLRATATLGCD
jgi:uncharacterized protein (TIGR03083 family)